MRQQAMRSAPASPPKSEHPMFRGISLSVDSENNVVASPVPLWLSLILRYSPLNAERISSSNKLKSTFKVLVLCCAFITICVPFYVYFQSNHKVWTKSWLKEMILILWTAQGLLSAVQIFSWGPRIALLALSLSLAFSVLAYLYFFYLVAFLDQKWRLFHVHLIYTSNNELFENFANGHCLLLEFRRDIFRSCFWYFVLSVCLQSFIQVFGLYAVFKFYVEFSATEWLALLGWTSSAALIAFQLLHLTLAIFQKGNDSIQVLASQTSVCVSESVWRLKMTMMQHEQLALRLASFCQLTDACYLVGAAVLMTGYWLAR